MKKFFITSILVVSALCSTQAIPLPVPLQIGYIDPSSGNSGGHRSPAVLPQVEIEGLTLYIYDVAYAFTLYLLDEEGEVAYTAAVAAGTPTVTLPSGLTGEYQLLLVPGGSYYFSGWIAL